MHVPLWLVQGDYAVMEKEWNLNEVQFFLSAQMFPDAENNGDDYGPYDPESDTKGKPHA